MEAIHAGLFFHLSIRICQIVIHTGITVCNQPITAKGLFYNSYDLIEYFMRDANANMVIYMNQLANT
jgi:hypothetical protein